ncbi:MAG: DUF5333 domain-containing protein [Tateyamaria sp.]|jgi:hypothetical protein|uniref:DUF5333 domain-containing protein n=1 Tax=Tateyamaria sp. TaxID=1929288 RepID=UPI0032DDF129
MRAMTMALIFCLSAGAISAKPHLREVSKVDDTLLAVGIADEIRKNCPDISARMIKAVGLIRGVAAHARGLGYTSEEIDLYRKSDTEKARLKAKRDAYLAAGGAQTGNSQSYCQLGRQEIEKGSLIGAVLRMN